MFFEADLWIFHGPSFIGTNIIRYGKVSGRMRAVGYIGLGLGVGTCLLQVCGRYVDLEGCLCCWCLRLLLGGRVMGWGLRG